MTSYRVNDVTVLHVDDAPGLCEVVADYLEMNHDWLDVVTADGADAGLELIESHEVDCVVSDYEMPRKDGLAFLREVRTEFPDLPFVLYTGKGSEEIASEAISAGVDEYLQKKSTSDQYDVLANRIKNLVDRERARTAATTADTRYHNLVDTAPVPIMLFDADARVVYVNDAALEFLAAEEESDLDAVTMPELLVESDQGRARERFEQLFETGEPLPETEFSISTLDGQVKRAVVATAPGVYKDRPVAQAVAKEIVEE